MTQTHITIKRPNGNTEIVIKDGVVPMPLRPQMEKATREAGRGDIIGWKVVTTPRGHVCDTVEPKAECCWRRRAAELESVKNNKMPVATPEEAERFWRAN